MPLYLTRSRLRADVLSLFFLNPSASFYLRELERRLGYAVGALARELQLLASGGLLQREKRGREIFYHLNAAHSLYPEIKGIVEKTCGVPVHLSRALKGVNSIQKAFLYGSFAKGSSAAGSDIDLLLVGRETDGLGRLLRKLEGRLGRKINATTYSAREFEAKKKNPEEFLFAVMRGPLVALKPEGERSRGHSPAPG